MRNFVVFVSLLCVAIAQKPCCVSDQFTAFVGTQVGQVIHNKPSAYKTGGPVTYDFGSQKMAVVVSTPDGSRKDKQILDYSQQAMFLIDLTRQKCQKLPLSGKMVRQCIPPNAKLVGVLSLAGTLKVQAWEFSVGAGNSSLLVTPDKCVPVIQVNVLQPHELSLMQTQVVFNFKTTVNPADFVPPPYCPKAFTSNFAREAPMEIFIRR